MGWIKRVEDEHKCAKPYWDSKVRRGDIWQCEDAKCGLQWKVRDMNITYDQRDGNYGTIDWVMVVAPVAHEEPWRNATWGGHQR